MVKEVAEPFSINPKKQGSVFAGKCFMGLGHLLQKQYVKAAFYMLIEIGFVLFMALVGIKTMIGFVTLGDKATGQQLNPNTGMYEQIVGDHSMYNMIYGIAVIIVACVFVALYIVSVLDIKKVVQLKEQGKSVKFGFKELFILADKKYYVVMLILPILGALFFSILPLIFMILIAFTNYSYPNHMPPSGLVDWTFLKSFSKLLTMNQVAGTFSKILLWTIIWAVSTTFFGFFGGLILALAIEKKNVKFKKIWRVIFLINFAVPQFVSLLVMRFFLYTYGPVNGFLTSIGLNSVNFLSDPVISKVVVIMVSIWCGIPSSMLLMVGVVGNIPSELYEAAEIDGAGKVKKLFSITLPYVMFMATPVLVTTFIGNFNNFGVIYFVTQGGPVQQGMYNAGQTDLLINWLYNLTINVKQYDIASAIGIIIFLISAGISLTVYKLSPSYKNENQFN